MSFPEVRPRRLRATSGMRRLVQESRLSVDCLVAPLFIVPGTAVKSPIDSLPGQFHFSVDLLLVEIRELVDLGIGSVILFGVPDLKDEEGMVACKDDGLVQTAIRAIKGEFPDLVVIADLCFCEYTTNGQCGVFLDGVLDNDRTLENLGIQAISLGKAGVDIVAPSGMIDGMVGGIRQSLDGAGFLSVGIMSYAVKYASAWYGPFREAVRSDPALSADVGARSGHQMNVCNSKEAIREVVEDIEQGADIVIVKPALAFLDIVSSVSQAVSVPTAAYNVSGEYSLIKLGGSSGLVDSQALMVESLSSMKRAGADIIISYFAKEYAQTCLSK